VYFPLFSSSFSLSALHAKFFFANAIEKQKNELDESCVSVIIFTDLATKIGLNNIPKFILKAPVRACNGVTLLIYFFSRSVLI